MNDDDLRAAKNHNFRRITWLEILAIYGVFIALVIWNWW